MARLSEHTGDCKDYKTSLSSCVNYSGISLFNNICKLFDSVLLYLYRSQLSTFDMQFGFKARHSTSLCTLIFKEVVINRGNVYTGSCLLDVSKLFDLVHYGKLFSISISKQILNVSSD